MKLIHSVNSSCTELVLKQTAKQHLRYYQQLLDAIVWCLNFTSLAVLLCLLLGYMSFTQKKRVFIVEQDFASRSYARIVDEVCVQYPNLAVSKYSTITRLIVCFLYQRLRMRSPFEAKYDLNKYLDKIRSCRLVSQCVFSFNYKHFGIKFYRIKCKVN